MPTTSQKQGYGPGTPQYDNLDPALQVIVNRILAESGGRVWIGSGWRSTQQQANLYDAWRSGTYDVPRVAPPGHSQHERGRAIDFGGDLRLAQELGRQYGLVFPMADEPWHGQLGGSSGGADPSGMGIQYNLDYTSGRPVASPQEVLANRMTSIMSIIGGDMFSSGATKFIEPADEAAQTGIPQMPEAGRYMIPSISGSSLFNSQVSYQPGGDSSQLGAYAQSLFSQFGFDEADYPALVELWNRESGDPRAGSSQVTWNPLAQNPRSSAFGIAQFLNGTWAGTGIQKTTNPQQQIMAGLMYIKSRYGNPRNALAFHNSNNYY